MKPAGSVFCRLASRVAGQGAVARSAHAAHPAPGHEPHAGHVHRYHASRTPTGLIIALITAAVVAGVLVAALLSGRGDAPTVAELKAKLGIAPDGAVNVTVSQVDFMNRLGTPTHREQDSAYLYFYYDVRGGTAVIVVDRGGWEVGEARIRHIFTR